MLRMDENRRPAQPWGRVPPPSMRNGGSRAMATLTAQRTKNKDAIDRDGGARRNRTDDLFNAIEALSQLSYGPTFFSQRRWDVADDRGSAANRALYR